MVLVLLFYRLQVFLTHLALGSAGGALAWLDVHVEPAIALLDGMKYNYQLAENTTQSWYNGFVFPSEAVYISDF